MPTVSRDRMRLGRGKAPSGENPGERSPGSPGGRPRLGVLVSHAIQYQAPLYRELDRRGVVDLDVAFLSPAGAALYRDPGFGIALAWDVDLLGGYRWSLLTGGSRHAGVRLPGALTSWLRQHDIVVLHGHSDPRMLLAAAACRMLGVPYLLRGESPPESSAAGPRRAGRHALASFTVRGAAGALPVGQRNAAFYHRYGSIPHFRAPYSVDNDRFRSVAAQARHDRNRRLASLGLDPSRPVAVFAGKLVPRKRPLDAVRAIGRCSGRLSLLMLGDGPLRDEVRAAERILPIRCPGFVNQADLPRWYACGDILLLPSASEPWGLVVNEGMACGLVPVVSDAVGCAADLADGVGAVFPVGDVGALARALLTVSREAPGRREKVRRRLEHFTLTETARGYEQAALALRRDDAVRGRRGRDAIGSNPGRRPPGPILRR